MNKPFKISGLPATTAAVTPEPLRLNLQFFAEDPPNDEPQNQSTGDTPNPDNSEDDPEDDISLAELLKQNPKLKSEYDQRVERAVKRRFKNHKPDKKDDKDDNNEPDNEELLNLKNRSTRLETKAKEFGIAAYAAEQGMSAEHTKLIRRLSANRINEISLDENGELDPEDVQDVVESIREEFPTLFSTSAGSEEAAPPPKKKKNFVPGAEQQTNTPPDQKAKGVEEMKARFERLNKKGRI